MVRDKLDLMNREIDLHLAELGDSTGVDPFDHEDIAVGIEAGIMRMDELAWLPSAWIGPDFETVQHFLSPCLVIAEVNDDVVVFVEERDAGMEIWNQ